MIREAGVRRDACRLVRWDCSVVPSYGLFLCFRWLTLLDCGVTLSTNIARDWSLRWTVFVTNGRACHGRSGPCRLHRVFAAITIQVRLRGLEQLKRISMDRMVLPTIWLVDWSVFIIQLRSLLFALLAMKDLKQRVVALVSDHSCFLRWLRLNVLLRRLLEHELFAGAVHSRDTHGGTFYAFRFYRRRACNTYSWRRFSSWSRNLAETEGISKGLFALSWALRSAVFGLIACIFEV